MSKTTMVVLQRACFYLACLLFCLAFWAAAVVGCIKLEKAAFGSPLDCEGIRDADQRSYCRAVTKKDASYCEVIKDHDLRFKCRAAVR
jgi:hypothetical protein